MSNPRERLAPATQALGAAVLVAFAVALARSGPGAVLQALVLAWHPGKLLLVLVALAWGARSLAGHDDPRSAATEAVLAGGVVALLAAAALTLAGQGTPVFLYFGTGSGGRPGAASLELTATVVFAEVVLASLAGAWWGRLRRR